MFRTRFDADGRCREFTEYYIRRVCDPKGLVLCSLIPGGRRLIEAGRLLGTGFEIG